jgi:hypothetical protein
MVESMFEFASRHAVFCPESLLDLGDPLADTDGRLGALSMAKDLLEIRGRGQVVGVGVCFEDANDVVALCFDG